MGARFRRRQERREVDAVPAGAVAGGDLVQAVRTRVADDERTAIERRVAAERVRRMQNLAVDRKLADLLLYSIAAGVKAVRTFRQVLAETELTVTPSTGAILAALQVEPGIEGAVGISISGFATAAIDQEGSDRRAEDGRMAVAALRADEEQPAHDPPVRTERPHEGEFQLTLLHALLEAALRREVPQEEVVEHLPLWLPAWKSGWLLFDDMRASYAPGAGSATS